MPPTLPLAFPQPARTLPRRSRRDIWAQVPLCSKERGGPIERAVLMKSLPPEPALLHALLKTLKPVPGLLLRARAKAQPLREPCVSVPGLSISC